MRWGEVWWPLGEVGGDSICSSVYIYGTCMYTCMYTGCINYTQDILL